MPFVHANRGRDHLRVDERDVALRLDFSRFDAPEDIVVRTIDGHDEQCWIDLLVTPR